MKLIPFLTLLFTLAIAPAFVHAADPTPAAAETTKAPPHLAPFRGTISEVDAAKGTFTISNKDKTKVRVFFVMKTTKLSKDDKDTTLAEVKAGDYARGEAFKTAVDKYELSSAKFGPKSAEEIAEDKAKKDAQPPK